MPSMHVLMPDMSDMHAQVSARRFAARRCHPRRPEGRQRIRYCSLPCTTPPMHAASHLPPTPAACELLAICPTPHALLAQLHTPRGQGSCAVISHCVPPPGCRAFFAASRDAVESGAHAQGQVRTYFCAPIFIVAACAIRALRVD